MKNEFKEHVTQLAHNFWLEDGQPDGEQYVESLLGPIKIKHIHWIKAELVAEIDFEILRIINTLNKQEL